jgi:hypothetical protein
MSSARVFQRYQAAFSVSLAGIENSGMLDKHRKKWRSKIRGWKDQILKTQNGAVDLHAQEMAADAERAMSVAAGGDVQFCQYSVNIISLASTTTLTDLRARRPRFLTPSSLSLRSPLPAAGRSHYLRLFPTTPRATSHRSKTH